MISIAVPYVKLMRAWKSRGCDGSAYIRKNKVASHPVATIERNHKAYENAVFQWKRAVLAKAGQLGVFAGEFPESIQDTGHDSCSREPMHNDVRADLDYCEEEYNITWDYRVDLELKRNRHVSFWIHNDPIDFRLILENGWETLTLYPHYRVLSDSWQGALAGGDTAK